MGVKLLHRTVAWLIVAAYLGATIAAAPLQIGACPAVDGAPHASHTHGHIGHQHHNGSENTAGECLKCCLGACLVAPCLSGATARISELAFVGTPVFYWAVSPAISGRAIPPDPGPPKPIA